MTSTTNTGTGASNEVLSMAELAAGKGFFPKCFHCHDRLGLGLGQV